MNGFGLIALSVFLIIVSSTVFVVYGLMENKFRSALKNPLLSYYISDEEYKKPAKNREKRLRNIIRQYCLLCFFSACLLP